MKTNLTMAVTAVAVLLSAGSSFGQEAAPPASNLPVFESPGPQDLPALSLPESPPTVPPAAPEEIQLNRGDYKADWRQAGADQDGLGQKLRSHIVRLDEDNSVRGRIAVIESGTGSLTSVSKVRIRFVRKGEVKATVTPSADGSFKVRGLKPGVYSMIAAGDDAFLAWSVNVQPKESDLAKMPEPLRVRYLKQEAKSQVDVKAAAVPPANFVPLKTLLNGYLPSASSFLYLDGNDIPDGMTQTPPADARLGTNLMHHQVRLSRDGKLHGRIRRLQPDSGLDLRIRQLNVFLLRNNEQVAQEEVAPNGTFAFADLRPGVYSMVAAGRDGFLAFSIDVLNTRQTEANENQIQTTSLRSKNIATQPSEFAIDVAAVPPEDLNAANVNQMTDDFPADANVGPIANAGPAPAPAPGGNFGPAPAGASMAPVGGSTVAPAAGGGLGSILTTVGAGIGAASLIDDDDGRRQGSPSDPGN